MVANGEADLAVGYFPEAITSIVTLGHDSLLRRFDELLQKSVIEALEAELAQASQDARHAAAKTLEHNIKGYIGVSTTVRLALPGGMRIADEQLGLDAADAGMRDERLEQIVEEPARAARPLEAEASGLAAGDRSGAVDEQRSPAALDYSGGSAMPVSAWQS